MKNLTTAQSQSVCLNRRIALATLMASCCMYLAFANRARAEDCNANSIEDATDIAAGTSLDCDEDGIPDECQGDVVSEDFNSYSPGDNPTNWFDTLASSSTFEINAFFVQQVGSEPAFGTSEPSTNIHSHYVGPGSAGISSMTFTGRMRIDNADSGIGVTFLSQFSDQPSSTYEYLRIRRANYAPSAQTFHFSPPNFDNFVGDKDSGVNPAPNTWYRFRIVVDTTGGQLHVQANIWEDGQAEPAGFQIDATDSSGAHPTSGTIGVWSMANGTKYWDDLNVAVLEPAVPCDDGDDCTRCDSLIDGICAGIPIDCSHMDDACHAGSCNAGTGLCEAVPANEGGGCDDADACTTSDACASGVCVGSPVDCSSMDDACVVGTCNPSSGLCETAPANEGGACDDLDMCTTNDACTGGACTGDSVDCSHLDDGCMIGTCNSGDGSCETTPANDGDACDDLDLCTENDTCLGGVCAGTPLNCSDSDVACLRATCNPGTGACETPVVSDCNANNIPDECEALTPLFSGKFSSPDTAEDDRLGLGLAIDRDLAVIGAFRHDGDGLTDSGAAYVYRLVNGTWQFEAKLEADDAADHDLFGFSVAISGSTAIISATGDIHGGVDSGSVYVFRTNNGTWQQIAKLVQSDAQDGDRFGGSIALRGSTAIIGARGDDDHGGDSGSAYVFREFAGVWQQVQKLSGDDTTTNDWFGNEVAVSGDLAVISATLGGPNGVDYAGSAYVFREIGGVWQQVAKLTADDAAPHDSFGSGLAISEDTIFVGATSKDDGLPVIGSVYIYRETGGMWQQVNKLYSDAPTPNSQFGGNLSISGNRAVIGAWADSGTGTQGGAVFVSTRVGGVWQPPVKIANDVGAADDYLGWGVAISGNFMLAGANRDDYIGTDSGSVYAWEFRMPDCNSNGVLDECEIASEIETDCNLNGIPDSCEAHGENSQDCSFLDDVCVAGVCDLANATCKTIPTNEGGACDDLDLCSEGDACNSGVCAGTAIDCSYLDNACLLGTCNSETGECDAPPAEADCNTNGVPDSCELSQETRVGNFNGDGAFLYPEKFGYSVAIHGDRALVGDPLNDFAEPLLDPDGFPVIYEDSGATHNFRRTNGTWEPHGLPGFSLFSQAKWGLSVAMDEETSLIGLQRRTEAGPDNGFVHVAWSRSAAGQGLTSRKLSASDGAPGDEFGSSVAVSQDVIISGASRNDDAGTDSGSAYIFELAGSQWQQVTKLRADDEAAGDRFGYSVSVNEHIAIVGAYGDDDDGSESGSAYVFEKIGGVWQQTAKLTADDASAGDRFGWAVSIDGVTAIIGASEDDDNGASSGSCYIFRKIDGIWLQDAKIRGDDVDAGDRFGWSVAIDGQSAVIGAPFDYADGGTTNGSAYVFRAVGGGWQQVVHLTPDNPAAGFGYSVAIDGNAVHIGADRATSGGASFIFDIPKPDCNENGAPDECDIASGAGSDANSNGVLDECEGLPTVLSILATPSAHECPGTVVTLNAVPGYASYAWEPGGETTQSIQVTTPGTYRATAMTGVGTSTVSGAISIAFGGSSPNAPVVLVSSKETDSVMAFDALTGNLLYAFTPPATNGLDSPNGITVDSAGHVYVAGVGSQSVMKFATLTGEFLHEFTGSLTNPVGVQLVEPDTLLVSNWSDDSVHKFDVVTGQALGQLVTTGAGGLDGPADMLISPTGLLLVSSQIGDQVLAYDAQSGAFDHVAAQGGGLDGPAGMFIDAQGNLLVASFRTDQVLRFDPDTGGLIDILIEDDPNTPGTDESGGLDGPEGLAWNSSGNLLVSNRFGGNILEFDGTTGAFVRVLAASGLNEPTYLTMTSLDPDCNRDHIPDGCPTDTGLAGMDCNSNGIGDGCDPDLDLDGLIDDCDPCAGGSASGDSDANGVIDMDDFAKLEPCLAGPGGSIGDGCECFDFDADGDNDLQDFADFVRLQ